MVRKICADGKKRIKTDGSMYFHNSYFFIDYEGVTDEEIAASISKMMTNDAGVPVDVVIFVEIDDVNNQFLTPNDLVKLQESGVSQFPIGAHRYVICDEALFKDYIETGATA